MKEGKTSLLQGKPFFYREWASKGLQHCLEGRGSGDRNCGVLVTGGPGSGKTALCTEVLWRTSEQGQKVWLGSQTFTYHFCQAHSLVMRVQTGWFPAVHGIMRLLMKSEERR